MRHGSASLAVVFLLLGPSGGAAEDTLGRPQVVGTAEPTGLVGRFDADGDFLLHSHERVFVAPGTLAVEWIRGRDGEACRSTGTLLFCDRNRSLDWNGNAGGDLATFFSIQAGAGALFYHDVDDDGIRQLVKYLPDVAGSDLFQVDANQNDRWDGVAGGDSVVRVAPGLGPGTPFACDCDGDGSSELGKVLPDGSTLALDLNGNGVWDGPGGGDALIAFGADAGPGVFLFPDLGSGFDSIVKYVEQVDGLDRFMIDANGNLRWDGTAGGDRWAVVAPGAGPGTPCAIDLEGDGASVLCKWLEPTIVVFIDSDGDGTWDGNAGGDFATNFPAVAGVGPIIVYDRPASPQAHDAIGNTCKEW